MALTLVIGNKNYSSWSLRPWIAMKVAGIPFEEKLIPLYEGNSKEQILAVSPAGKVPVLIDRDMAVWESIAILEHLADRFPDAKIWPADAKARSFARTIASEMHSGFGDLRQHCPMNMRRVGKKRANLPPEVLPNVKRIDAIWNDARSHFGEGGPFLFGSFGAADAMYAPVVSRFISYDLPVSATSKAYMNAVTALPAWKEWQDAGVKESWVMTGNELD